MKRTARDKRNRFSNIARPVQKVELDEANAKGKIIAAVCLAVVGASLLSYAFVHFLNKEEGWSTVVADSSSELNCSEEFVFNYDFSDGTDNKALKGAYTSACVKAYQMFTCDEEYEELGNIAYINAHPNEKVQVETAIYAAFEAIEGSKDRSIYLGPIYDYYDNVFYCTDDSQLLDYDAHENSELAQEYATIADYAADENAVNIKLLGDNMIELVVSDDYLEYADENAVSNFIDFYWMRNAFITDYIADALIDAGYTHGILASDDGFTRAFSRTVGEDDESDDDSANDTADSLEDNSKTITASSEEDNSKTDSVGSTEDNGNTISSGGEGGADSAVTNDGYAYKLYHLEGNTIYTVGSFAYDSTMSIVTYRSYGINDSDSLRFYDTKDGRTLTQYLSLEDGMDRCSTDELTVMSDSKSCVEVLLATKGYFIADEFDEADITALSADDIYTVCFDGRTVVYNYDKLSFDELYEKNGVKFETKQVKQ